MTLKGLSVIFIACLIFNNVYYVDSRNREEKNEIFKRISHDSGRFYHLRILFDSHDNCKTHLLNTDTLMELIWFSGRVFPPCIITIEPVNEVPFCFEIEAENIPCPFNKFISYTTAQPGDILQKGSIQCRKAMNQQQCFLAKTRLTIMFASRSKKSFKSHLSMKFYTKDPTTDLIETEPQLLCSDGWESFKGHCYKFSNDVKNWTEAMKTCEAIDSKLVRIESSEENDWIFSHQKEVCTWIGGIRAYYGDFVWYDDQEDIMFTNWFYGEPNNNRGNEDCISLNCGTRGYWNDEACSVNNAYVCEKSLYIYV